MAQIAYEVAEQLNCKALKKMEEYNDTRRWRCYEAALLMKKNEIRTDEEAPLTTPVDASVLRHYQVQRKKESVPSLRHRGSFLGKAAHP